MHHVLRLIVALAVGAVALVAVPKCVKAQEGESPSAAMQANRGFKLGVGPTLLLPRRSGGPYGAGLTLDGRYGIQAGPTVLAPGGRLAGYYVSDRYAALAMPTFRVTVPVGPLAPFLIGGVGGGWLSNESESGVALLGGGGLMIHVGRFVAFGAEASYQVITSTELKVVTVGPSIAFGG